MNLPGLSAASERVIATAADEGGSLGHRFVGVEHVFLGLAGDASAGLEEALGEQGIDLRSFAGSLRAEIEGVTHPTGGEITALTPRCAAVLQLAGRVAVRIGASRIEPCHIVEAIAQEGRSVPAHLLVRSGVDLMRLQASTAAVPARRDSTMSGTPLLDRFGRDLTAMAMAGRLSPVIGRAEELGLLQQVLLRRNKNNPVLVGEAGVGKTAVVEGLAARLLSPDCPAPLRGRRIVELSVSGLVAGTKYRGDFEERLLGVVAEVSSHPEVILFLDEIHTLVGAGVAGGEALDAANILKPALARGELRCVGATTTEEYRRHIERDPALERRFDRIAVEEPTPETAVEILSGLALSFESHHQVVIPPETLSAAVQLTMRWVPDRRLPDKALDALDQCCARKRLEGFTRGTKGAAKPNNGPTRILPDDIAATVAQWTGLPLEHLTGRGKASPGDLGETLRRRVVGQDHAVDAVARAVAAAKAGLAPGGRPLGVFLFLGPTGVGKTELAKALGEALFGDERRVVRFDMSEYGEPHAIAKLIGAPPGYVGFEREGLLVSALRSHPHSVVLFDEIEKAHADVFDLFLQIFDDGRLSGAHGKTADFTQAIVILTSNLAPAPAPPPARPIGFVPDGEGEPAVERLVDLRAALAGYFRPEFVNRLDDIVLFGRLSRPALFRILDRYLGEIDERLRSRQLRLDVDDSARSLLLDVGESARFGARELRRVVDRFVRQALAEKLLESQDRQGTIRVSARGGEVAIDLP